MKHIVNRRAFIAGLAGAGAACTTSSSQPTPPPMAEKKETNRLTVYFTGLIVFAPDQSTMKIGLLEHGHETIVVARRADVDQKGLDLDGDQFQAWNPAGLALDMKDLTYWKGRKFAFTPTTTDAFEAKLPLGVFPLTKLANRAPALTAGNCQSLVTVANGRFTGQVRTHSCGHDSAKWQMVKSAADTAPPLKDVYLNDTVKYEADITGGSFSVDGTTIKFNPTDVAMWVLHIDAAGTMGKNPREIIHCKHYFDVVPDYTGDRYYPYRDEVPKTCKAQVDVDPIYCTPGE